MMGGAEDKYSRRKPALAVAIGAVVLVAAIALIFRVVTPGQDTTFHAPQAAVASTSAANVAVVADTAVEEPAIQQNPDSKPMKVASRVVRIVSEGTDSVTDYYPLIVAGSGHVKDLKVIGWLRDNLADAKKTPDGSQQELAAGQLEEILAHTNLGASELARIGIALYQRQYPAVEHAAHENALEAAAGLRFLLKAQDKAAATLAALPAGSAAGMESVAVLKSLIDPLIHETRWDVLLNVFGVLIPWEPQRSDARYYDRWKYADMYFQCQRFDEALSAIDSLVADVRHGDYGTANMKDLCQLRWNICARSGRAEDGLTFLREAVAHPVKATDPDRISVILIRALAQTGHLDEARERFSRWENTQDPNSGSAGIEALKQEISLGAWTIANQSVPSR